MLVEQGFAAVSHRAVAGRAGLPLSSTTYYFASLDELIEGAVRGLADNWRALARRVVADLPERIRSRRQLAEAILRVATLAPATGAPTEPDTQLALYERYLEAARHPQLRPIIIEFDEELDAVLAEVLRRGGVPSSRATARLVLAVVDGALLRALAEGQPPTAATAPLTHLLRSLDGPGDQRPPG